MREGTPVPAAAPPTDRPFAAALSAFNQARETYIKARDASEAAQREQVEAIGALPEDEQPDMARLEAIGDRLKLGELGDALFAAFQDAEAALQSLVAVPAGSSFELFQKMSAVYSAPWETGDHSAQLLSDAAETSGQFGRVWLRRWTEKGGAVSFDHDRPGKAWVGHPTYERSPLAVEDEARMTAGGVPEEQREERRRWHRAFYDGKMRELSDILDAMPGGIDAVRALVAVTPALGLPRTAGEEVRGGA